MQTYEVSNRDGVERNLNAFNDLLVWIAEHESSNREIDIHAIYDGERAYATWPFRNEKITVDAKEAARGIGLIVEETNSGWVALLPLPDLWEENGYGLIGACRILAVDVYEQNGTEMTVLHSVDLQWRPDAFLFEQYGWSAEVVEKESGIVVRYSYEERESVITK